MGGKKDDLVRVTAFIAKLKYVLADPNCQIRLQFDRRNDANRPVRYTNRYTISKLFSKLDPVKVMKRELANLSVQDYVETISDRTKTNLSDFYVFSKEYEGSNVYIKIRVEALSPQAFGQNYVFVMSFHFAEFPISHSDFPHRI